jgi:lipid-A-disaccharide synthase
MPNNEDSPLIYLIAGEASGDLLASRLMAALIKKTDGKVRFAGVGGDTMRQAGFQTLYDNSELAVMGFAEVLPRIPKILKLINMTVKDIADKRPDIVITVDSWSFSERIHKKLKGMKIPHIHYVAPQVWAWREKRAAKVGKKVDALLSLLPFETGYFKKYGLDTTCVGHPVVETCRSLGNGDNFRNKYGIAADRTIISVLPGSRHSEVRYLLPIFADTIRKLQQQIPDLFIVMPTVNAVADTVSKYISACGLPVMVLCGNAQDKADAFAASDIALAASGTVSLELAIAGLPHLIAYKMSPITAYFARRLLKIKYVNLINLIANYEIIPELLQENCTPDILAYNLMNLLKNKEKSRMQIGMARKQLEKLGYGQEKTPSEKAADKVLGIIQKKQA